MNSSNYKKTTKSKYFIFIIFIISSMLMTSCIIEDYRDPANLDILMDKTIKFADDFNHKRSAEGESLLGLNFRINKNKKIKKAGDNYIYYEISIPYNLRGKELKEFLEEFTNKYMKTRRHMLVDIKHMYVERFSGIVASYEVILKDKSVKLDVKFNNYLSKKNLQKKGIKHYLLQYDYQILAQVSQEFKKHKHISLNSAIINVANHYKITVEKIKKVLTFTRKYYKKN